jgi:putative DNA primase/helicase
MNGARGFAVADLTQRAMASQPAPVPYSTSPPAGEPVMAAPALQPPSVPSGIHTATCNCYHRLDVTQLANLPKELRNGKRFVCWRVGISNGKPTKIPVNPYTGSEAKSDDSTTWSILADAVAHYEKHCIKLHGVGRMFGPDDRMMGVDFDDCLDESGEFIPGHPAEKWLPLFDSYTEISPSGMGVKTWVYASHLLAGKTGKRDKEKGVEVYRERKYFTLTGKRLAQYSANVENRQPQVDAFFQEYFPEKKSATSRPVTPTTTVSTDAQIISRASGAKNGDKFRALWSGSIADYPSHSEADVALCSLLWFWTGGDREAVRRLFGQSVLGQRDKWQRRDYQERTLDVACRGEVYSPILDELHAALVDLRPKVRLPGDNWLLSQTATELGEYLAEELLFVCNDEIVTLDAGELRPITAQTFRTFVERYVVCYRKCKAGDNTFDVGITMSNSDANGIMASSQFTERLRHLSRVNSCRLPILRDSGELELLPEGYDAASKILTTSSVTYKEDLPLNVAVETINDLFSEFVFADGDRSKAVAVAALVGLYGTHLPPDGSLRPCFIVTKNAEGAGATTLVACAVVPILGMLPTGVASSDEEEMRKMLTSRMREARPVVVLDNQKTRLSSSALESFLTSPTWSDRKLGVNETVTCPNIATVFVTANGCTISPDMRRRSLIVELHLEVERAEDRQFRRPLDIPTLLALRSMILAACWSLVRHWHRQGQPPPSRTHSAFPPWASIVGGIVQAAGFACPLDPANVAITADDDGDAMRRLVEAMEPGRKYAFPEIVAFCQANDCFVALVGAQDTEMTNGCRVTLAKILGRYDNRQVSHVRFLIEGTGHKRRYHVE